MFIMISVASTANFMCRPREIKTLAFRMLDSGHIIRNVGVTQLREPLFGKLFY